EGAGIARLAKGDPPFGLDLHRLVELRQKVDLASGIDLDLDMPEAQGPRLQLRGLSHLARPGIVAAGDVKRLDTRFARERERAVGISRIRRHGLEDVARRALVDLARGTSGVK